jgi:hypothetical protein
MKEFTSWYTRSEPQDQFMEQLTSWYMRESKDTPKIVEKIEQSEKIEKRPGQTGINSTSVR